MNGVVNFSVLDGWWLEGYREGAGWALTEKRTYQNQEHQDQLDAATIYKEDNLTQEFRTTRDLDNTLNQTLTCTIVWMSFTCKQELYRVRLSSLKIMICNWLVVWFQALISG